MKTTKMTSSEIISKAAKENNVSEENVKKILNSFWANMSLEEMSGALMNFCFGNGPAETMCLEGRILADDMNELRRYCHDNFLRFLQCTRKTTCRSWFLHFW
jgi:hypothetical protein